MKGNKSYSGTDPLTNLKTDYRHDYDGRAMPLMLNYLMDWNPGDVFGLYAGAGIGFSFNKMDATNMKAVAREDGTYKDGNDDKSVTAGDETPLLSAKSDDPTNFAWQFQLGTSLTFAESYKINLGYRYLSTGEFDFSNDLTPKVKGGHSIIDLGFRYQF
ncbi:MAG: porin family protein [Opitutae bacterium]|nr:porin family protein [Opitutae bacterium]